MRGDRLRMLGGVAASLLFFGAFAGPAMSAGMPGPKVEYSADNYTTVNGKEVKYKMYQAPAGQRMDFEEGGKQSIIIVRPDKKVSWVLMPEQKTYLEMGLEEGKAKSKDVSECSVTRSAAGRDTVNGVSAARHNVEMSCPDGSRFTGTMWTSKDEIMLKVDLTGTDAKGNKTSLKSELKNLKVGRLPAGTLEVPAGYKLMKMPGMGDFKNMFTAPPPQRKVSPAKKQSAPPPQDTGRSYTSQGRSYTAQPRSATEENAAPARKEKTPAASSTSSEEAGRSYTSQGRSYTAQPREKSTVDKVLDPAKSIKRLFKW